jgi:hypothetical protein
MPPRILYLLRNGPPSLESHLLTGLLSMPGAPQDAAICVLGASPPPAIAGATTVALPTALADRRGAPRAVVRAITDLAAGLGVRLIHSIGAEAQLVGGRAARRARVASVWSQVGVASWDDLRELRASLMSAHTVLAYTAVGLAAQRRLPRGARVRPVPLGVPIPPEPRGARNRRARSTLGIPADTFVAALAGPVARPDGVLASFLAAGRTLCHARAGAHLLVPAAARGTEREVGAAIQATAGALRGAGRIHELGAADDDLAVYDAADVVAYDAHPAALPLGVLFAMAAGAAVVAADRALVRELADDRAEAVFVPPGDAEALAVALLALADDPDQREVLALAGEARVRERGDATAMAAAATAVTAALHA